MDPLVVPLQAVGLADVARVGGKNASLGEMLSQLSAAGVRVPDGFATTAAAYRLILDQPAPSGGGSLRQHLAALLQDLVSEDLVALQAAGAAARQLLLQAPLPPALEQGILSAYRALGAGPVAVRSSATAEDLPDASFAGQQESLLNVEGADALLAACRRCVASLFTDRAIVYRQQRGYDHLAVALSVGVQRLVRAGQGAAGVMFTLDTESGCTDLVLLNAVYGFGESLVQGSVNPDELLLFKPTLAQGFRAILSRRPGSKAQRLVADPCGGLRAEPVPVALQQRLAISDDEALQLARWAVLIEQHTSQRCGRATPMDIEWARDGISGELFILQARPETVQSRRRPHLLRQWRLAPHSATPLVSGRAVGSAVSSGHARVLADPSQIHSFGDGDLLVSHRTDPDWEPILRRASGVITDQGGRTCHAAIIARELGITAIVGTGDGSRRIVDGQPITASCCEGDEGHVYPGLLPFSVDEQELEQLPTTSTRLLLNLGNPEEAFVRAQLPCDGVGLARLEFLIASQIGIHPLALLQPQRVSSPAERSAIAERISGYSDGPAYYVARLSEGMARMAAAFYPRPVQLRFSDFKSNEYARLLGGRDFEPVEENPMLGWRGAARYADPAFAAAFGLECAALLRVRQELGLVNAVPMVPFCRNPAEADRVLAAMAAAGLVRGQNGLQVTMMCELPANVLQLEAYCQRFDGFSIGSNDLTQLTLGVDRDSARVAGLFDERHPAVLELIRQAIRTAHRCHRTIGLCGQAPSDDPGFVDLLLAEGIDAISFNPDALIRGRLQVAAAEQRLAEARSGSTPAPHGPGSALR
jgi:pyruvate,water dikinase